jgi:hypothetical protein
MRRKMLATSSQEQVSPSSDPTHLSTSLTRCSAPPEKKKSALDPTRGINPQV